MGDGGRGGHPGERRRRRVRALADGRRVEAHDDRHRARNETGRSELDRLAQQLTDTAVVALAQNPAYAIIGNAAILGRRESSRT
jgi:hypothetical protein